MSVVTLVAWRGDPLAEAVERALRTRDRPSMWLDPRTLSSRRVTLDSKGLQVEGRDICGVLWRVRPDAHFSVDFVSADQLFADVEARAFWLAALHSDTLQAPFRPEAAVFFTGGGWLLWRRRLEAAHVQVSPLGYGAVAVDETDAEWLPYQHTLVRSNPGGVAMAMLGAAVLRRNRGRRVLIVGSEVIDIETRSACPHPNVLAAATALSTAGVVFAELWLDSDGAVLTVDPFPWLSDSALISGTAATLAVILDAPVDRW